MALFGIGKSDKGSSILEMGKTILKDAQEKVTSGRQVSADDALEAEAESSVIGKGKDMLKGVAIAPVRVAIKGSGAVIRKIYETRINVVNEFSDIKPDWEFVDEDTVRKDIKELEKELKNALNGLKGKNVELKKASNLLDALLIANSLLNDNFQKCDEIIENYNLLTPFSLYGIRCLKEEKNGNIDDAKSYAMQYYNANNQKVNHPRISFLVAKELYEAGKYKQAIEAVEYSIRKYPDNIEIHRLLYNLHVNMGNQKGEKVEKGIISLLDACKKSIRSIYLT